MSIAVEVTKLMVEHLQSIVPDAECRRSYLPMLDPQELDEIGKTVLCVVPFEREAEHYTQGGMQKNSLEIDICINAKLNHRNDELEAFIAEIDSLIDFAEKIYAIFLKKNVKSGGGLKVTFDQPEHVLLFDHNALHSYNCFFSVVRVSAEVFVQPSGGAT
jgi:hypothetical protein